MIKCYCDLCNKELEEKDNKINYSTLILGNNSIETSNHSLGANNSTITYQLCPQCLMSVMGLITTIKTKGGMPTYIELLKEQDLFGFSDTKKKK